MKKTANRPGSTAAHAEARPLKLITINIGQRMQNCQEKIITLIERHQPHVLILTETREVRDLPRSLRPAYPELRFDAFRQLGYATHVHAPSYEDIQARALSKTAEKNRADLAPEAMSQIHAKHIQTQAEKDTQRHTSVLKYANSGVTFLIRTDIPHEVIMKDASGYEMQCELKPIKQQKIVIHAIYGRQNSDSEKKTQWKAIYETTRIQRNPPSIIVGDFNCVSDPTVDCRQMSHHGVIQRPYQRLRHPAEKYFQKLTSLHGGEYTDAWRHHNGPNSQEFTCLSTIKKGTTSEPEIISESRIDGFLVLNHYKDLIKSCVHGEATERFTDHLPAILEIELAQIPLHPSYDRHVNRAQPEKRADDKIPVHKRKVINNERLRLDADVRHTYLEMLQKHPILSINPEDVNDPTQALHQLNQAMSDSLDQCKLRRDLETAQHSQQQLFRHRAHDQLLQALRTNYHRNLRSRAALLQYFASRNGNPLPKIINTVIKHNLPEWTPSVEILAAPPKTADLQEWFRQLSKLTRKLGKVIKQRERTVDTQFFRERCDKLLALEQTNTRKWFRQVANPEKRIQLTQRRTLATVTTADGTRSAEPEVVRKTIQLFYQDLTKKQACEANSRKHSSSTNTSSVLPDHLELYSRRAIFNTIEWRRDADSLILPVQPSELEKTLQRLANNKAAGPDELTGETYKYFDPKSLAFEHLRCIINNALSSSRIPDQWRQAQVFLLHKSGDETQVSNYRPITLSNISYKILMSIITRRLNNIFERNEVLTNAQGGFQPRRGCEQKTAQSTAIHQHALQNHRELSTMYIDIAKAYDSVPHQAIIDTLTAIRLPQQFIDLIKQIYTDNTIRILTPHGLTDPIQLSRGLRQGCPASCPLFNLFLDPVLYKINSSPTITGYTYMCDGRLERIKSLCYADDLKFVSNTMQDLQRMAKVFAKFAIFNGTRLSLEAPDSRIKQKTVFSTSQRDWNTPKTCERTFEIKVYDPTNAPHYAQMRQVPRLGLKEPYKYLGILTTHDLTWDSQLHILENKANKLCSYHSQKIFSLSQAIRATNAILIPRLLYCLTAIPPSQQLDESLRKINKSITSMIKRKLGLHHAPTTLQLPFKDLGLCVPNITAMAAATQIQAIAKALNSNDEDTAKISIATYCKHGNAEMPDEIGAIYRDDLVYDLGIEILHRQSIRSSAGFVDDSYDRLVSYFFGKEELQQISKSYPEFFKLRLVRDLLQQCPSHPDKRYDQLRPWKDLQNTMDSMTYHSLRQKICSTYDEHNAFRVAWHVLDELHPNARRRIYLKTPLSRYGEHRVEGSYEVWTDASTKTSQLPDGSSLTSCAYAIVSAVPPLNFSRTYSVINHTNNTGELAAIVHAISACPFHPLRIFTDSLSQKLVADKMISEIFTPYAAHCLPRALKNEPNESLIERRKLYAALMDRKMAIADRVNAQILPATVDVEDITSAFIQIHHVYSHIIDNPGFNPDDESTWTAEQMQRIETMKANPYIGSNWYHHANQNQKADLAAEAARLREPQLSCGASIMDDEFLVCEHLKSGQIRVIADPRREIQSRIAHNLCQKYLQGVQGRELKKAHADDRRVPLALHPAWDHKNPTAALSIDKTMMSRCLHVWSKSHAHDGLLKTAIKLWHDTMPSSAATAFRALENAIRTGDNHAFYVLPLKYAISPECPHNDCNKEETRWHAVETRECRHEYPEISERLYKIRELVYDALPSHQKYSAESLPNWWHQQFEPPSALPSEELRPFIEQLRQFDKSLGSRAIIPSVLRPLLKRMGVQETKLDELIVDIVGTILQGIQSIWRSRCRALQKRWTDHKSSEALQESTPRNLWYAESLSSSSDSETDAKTVTPTHAKASHLIRKHYKRREKEISQASSDQTTNERRNPPRTGSFTFGTLELLTKIRKHSELTPEADPTEPRTSRSSVESPTHEAD